MANGRPRVFGAVSEEEIKGRALVSIVAYEVEPLTKLPSTRQHVDYSEISGEFNRTQVYCLGTGFRTR